jgi:hypothetical protein
LARPANLARKPRFNPTAQREERQAKIDATPLVSSFAGIEEVGVTLAFDDPEGKQQPSPRGVSFAPDMHAFFQFSCPMRDCTGGGFDANDDLHRALKRHEGGHTGTMSCEGVRPRSGVKDRRCDIRLRYTLAIRDAAPAAKAARSR